MSARKGGEKSGNRGHERRGGERKTTEVNNYEA